jgi:UDP-N-acetylglucosamine 3-dehydrogenase
MSGAELVGIYDLDARNTKELCRTYNSEFFPTFEPLLESVDVVYVATPTITHYEIGKKAIESGKDVFIEKPLADTAGRADELVELAERHQRRVVVGHVERFNPVIRWFRENLNPVEILSINITRVGPRPPQIKDVGIVVDLAVHDIDLVAHLCQSTILNIEAVAKATNGGHEDVAQIILKTETGVVSSITTNWLTPYKSRKIEIATGSAFFVGDLIAGTVIKYEAMDLSGSKYVVESQTPRGAEPLMEQSRAFLNSIHSNEAGPNATVEEGCRTVHLALRCLRNS